MSRDVIVTGGRHFDDAATVAEVLEMLSPVRVIQGGASGADRLARDWARKKGVITHTVSADWATHGRAAGPHRNRKMLELFPDAVIVAFPGGRGTADCVRQAKALGRVVHMISVIPSETAEAQPASEAQTDTAKPDHTP